MLNSVKEDTTHNAAPRCDPARTHRQTLSQYAVRSTAAGWRRRRRWIILLVIAAGYYLSWCFAWQIGLVAPRANMRYYYFSENESLDKAFFVVYWPMIRLGEVIETTRWGASGAIYYRERSFPTAEEMSGLGP